MSIVRLPANQPQARFYRGGAQIRQFRSSAGAPAAGGYVPEDWVGSTTSIFGENPTGKTRLLGGETLADIIEEGPVHWLGHDHVSRFGGDTMLLVKLLDAGQRLPIHFHPWRDFANAHLGRTHGKAEAWSILKGGTVYLGFRHDVTAEEVSGWVSDQNVSPMIEAMHAIEVSAGDSVFVPPGVPHAIGEGVFLVEVQEPEDLSILLEWKGFDIDGAIDGHLGLGFATALTAIDRRGLSTEQIGQLVVRQGSGESSLPAACQRYFRAERWTTDSTMELEPGFSIIVVTAGAGTLRVQDGERTSIERGDTLLVPHGAGALSVSGQVEFMRCRPPAAVTTG